MILEHSDVLHTLAQVSITLAGFIGVILVFQHADRSARNTIFHLLYTSLGVFCLSVFPLLIQPAFKDLLLIDRICCPLMGLWHGYGSTRAFVESRRNELALPSRSAMVFATGSYLLLALGLAVGFGWLLDFSTLVYFVGLGWLLAVAISAFISLLFRGSAKA